MAEVPTKPYLIRALYEWCADSGYRPFIAVVVDEHTLVPRESVRNGEIVLNISATATNRLHIGNELLEFEARFSGVARHVSIPIDNISAIFAQETGHGMAFEVPARAGHDDEHSGAETADAQGRGDDPAREEAASGPHASDASARAEPQLRPDGAESPGAAPDARADEKKAATPRAPRRARKPVLREVKTAGPAAPPAPVDPAATPGPGSDEKRAKPRSRRPSIAAVPPHEAPGPANEGPNRPASGPDGDEPGPRTPPPRKPRLTRVK